MENSVVEIDGVKRPMTAEEIKKYLDDALSYKNTEPDEPTEP
jgi:hypothetical protein